MANWCFPVNMNLIFFGSLDLEKEEKCLTLKENGHQDTRVFGQTLSAQQSRQQQAHGGNGLIHLDTGETRTQCQQGNGHQ